MQEPEVAEDLAVAEDADSDSEGEGDAEEQGEAEEGEGGKAESRGDEVEERPGESIGDDQPCVAAAARLAHGARPAQLVMQVAGKIPGVNGGLDDFVAELDAETGGCDAGSEFDSRRRDIR
jgi:hypothetical protein